MSRFGLAGVMGWPVGHSRSPALHGYWLKRYGIAGAYVPLAVPPDGLQQALRALPILGFAGCNVTVPHKESAFRTVDHTDAAARRTGSVNLVIVRPDGTLEGRSTDGYGFIENLRQSAPQWVPGRGPVMLIGAGGAARAIAAALLDAGETRLRIVNRTDARAAALAQDFGAAVEPWPWALRTVAATACHLLVNATILGMTGQNPLPLDLALLPKKSIVCDIVYVPLETPLLAAARARGNFTVDGLGMLLHQARPAFASWFGLDPAVDDGLRRAVMATLPP
ncbi:MAG: shikimate dehydrogenase [Aliidongia sp.]